jgi:tetratricopeptide (TPR) repeat protein
MRSGSGSAVFKAAAGKDLLVRDRMRCLTVLVIVSLIAATGCGSAETRKHKHLEAAQRFASDHQYTKAILEYRNALKIDPLYGDARYGLAEALTKLPPNRDLAIETVKEYSAAAELLPANFDAQLKAATFLLAGGDFAQARIRATKALALNPKSADAATVYAMSLAGLKDLSGALKEIREAVQLDPQSSRVYVNLGTMEAGAGNAEEAEAALKNAVRLAPNSPDANTALGYFYWSRNRLDEAEKALRAAAAVTPVDRSANEYLALFYMLQRRYADAEAPLQRLMQNNDSNAALMLGDVYVQEGKSSEARPLFESLVANKALKAAALRRIAILDYDTGHKQQAQDAVDAVLKNDPSNWEFLTLKAGWSVKEHQYAAGEALASAAIKANGSYAPAHFWYGAARLAQGDRQAAESAFRETLRLDPQSVDAKVQLARVMLANGNNDDALSYAVAARKARPSVDAQADVVRALLAKHDLVGADAELAVLQKQRPDDAVTHTLHGLLLNERSEFAKAAGEFDRALDLDPNDLAALTGRLNADAKQKHFAEGRARLDARLTATPNDSPLLVLAASFELAASDQSAAEQYLRRAISANPNNLSAYTMLAQLYAHQRRLEEAKAEYRQIIAKRPQDVWARTMLGVMLDAQGRADEAIALYSQIVKDAPQSGIASNNLAYYYATRNEHLPEALQLARAAKRAMPDSADVDDTLGLVYYKQGLYTEAANSYERYLTQQPGSVSARYRLGLSYAKAGQTEKARASLEKALAADPNAAEAPAARDTLKSLAK